MYIDHIGLKNFRTFRTADVYFVHPDLRRAPNGLPWPKLRNVNLLLGNNGLGKTALLKAIAIACLGPAAGRSGIFPYRLIRREPAERRVLSRASALVEASFTPHEQDRVETISVLESRIEIRREGDLESIEWAHRQEKRWHPVYSSDSDALFFVGYGASRRVEEKSRFDPGARRGRMFARALRVQSLFEETYSLVPLNSWLPEYRQQNPRRYQEVVSLINKLLGKEHYKFTGRMEEDEYVFERGGLQVPFPALSDGYQAYLGWIGDLLYHVCTTCPPEAPLTQNRGIVMVDEIDLHLHPKWQMEIVPTLARALPNIQFILTTHSPLIVGSLESANIILMKPTIHQASKPVRVTSPVHGLDADQVLLTDFFGLKTTRASGKARLLRQLTLKARTGDIEAAKKLLAQLSSGDEQAADYEEDDGEEIDDSADDQ